MINAPEKPAAAPAQTAGALLEDKLFNLRYKTDETRSHLVIAEPDVCARVCQDKPCTIFCPVGVYKWEPLVERISVSYEKCVECGACRIGCPYYNIEWVYPRGGFGVTYKNG